MLKGRNEDGAKQYTVVINLVLLWMDMSSSTEKKASLMEPKGRIKIKCREDNLQDRERM